MDNVNIGLALNIAGPAIMLILTIVGAVKAWPYRTTDKERSHAIYKPFKYWGLGIWMAFSLAGTLLVMNA